MLVGEKYKLSKAKWYIIRSPGKEALVGQVVKRFPTHQADFPPFFLYHFPMLYAFKGTYPKKYEYLVSCASNSNSLKL